MLGRHCERRTVRKVHVSERSAQDTDQRINLSQDGVDLRCVLVLRIRPVSGNISGFFFHDQIDKFYLENYLIAMTEYGMLGNSTKMDRATAQPLLYFIFN